MKIKALFVAVAVLACGSVFAQESNRDANGKIQYGPYQTNKFFQNWYIGVGGGANMGWDGVVAAIKDKKFAEETKSGFGFNAEAVIGKNITPCFGVRLGYQGHVSSVQSTLKDVFNPFTFNMPKAAKDYSGTPGAGPIRFNYVHVDALWNWSNQFAGYKEKRVVEVVPYIHAGLAWNSNDFNAMSSVAGGLGLMIPFRIGTRVHIIPDFRAVVFNDKLFYGVAQDGYAGNLSATLGLTVGLGKQNFTRVSTTVATTAAALAAAEAAKNALQADRDKLANQLNAANADRDALAKQLENLKNQPTPSTKGEIDLNKAMAIFFNKGKATLSNAELEHLDFYVKNVIANNKSLKFTIAGSADSATGSKAGNQALSQKRADYIYNLLTKKYGLTKDNFTVKALGGVSISSNPELDRAVLIENN